MPLTKGYGWKWNSQSTTKVPSGDAMYLIDFTAEFATVTYHYRCHDAAIHATLWRIASLPLPPVMRYATGPFTVVAIGGGKRVCRMRPFLLTAGRGASGPEAQIIAHPGIQRLALFLVAERYPPADYWGYWPGAQSSDVPALDLPATLQLTRELYRGGG